MNSLLFKSISNIKMKQTKMISNGFLNQINSIHTTAFNMIKPSEVLDAEPLKAKKRIDPQVLLARENRKRKKIEKEIKKIEKFGRRLKPVLEQEADRLILKEKELRTRKVEVTSKAELDDEYFLKKEWTNFVQQQHLNQMHQIERALKFQQRALKELKADNMNLYNMAIQLDEKLIPFVREGPVHNPPNPAYEATEGDYADTTYLYDKRHH